MSIVEAFDIISRFCHSCISGKDLHSINDIYNGDNINESYCQMFFNCFNIELKSSVSSGNDNIWICNECIKRLTDAYSFKLLTISTQNKLLSIKTEPEENKYKIEANEDNFQHVEETNYVTDFDTIYSQPIHNDHNKQTDKQENKKTRKQTKIQDENNTTSKLDEKLALVITDKDIRSCFICGKHFSYHRNLVLHMTEHYPNYICNICGKAFLKKCNLEGHIRRHQSAEMKCKICNKTFKKYILKSHMEVHRSERDRKPRTTCPECGLKFYFFAAKRKHMREMHKYVYGMVKCEICGKDYTTKAVLKNHKQMVHEKKVNFTCNLCGKGFFNRYKLDNHMLSHTGIRNFSCEVCKKSFLKIYTLKQHMKIHNNEKNFVCQICNKAFTYKCSLKGHMNTHHSDNNIKI